MIMNYDDFKSIVPERTKKFVDKVLEIYQSYIIQHNFNIETIINENNQMITNYQSKIFIIFLLALEQLDSNDITLSFFDRYERIFKITDKIDERILNDNKKNFNKLSEILCPFNFYENYMYLTPERIIYNNISKDELSAFFYADCKKMVKEYKNLATQEENKLIHDIEMNFYKDLPYDLIVFLEKSAQIFYYFNRNSFSNEIIKTYDDYVISSLLISIYLNKSYTSNYLDSKGITKNYIGKKFEFNYYSSENDVFENDYFIPSTYVTILKKYYSKIIFEGKNKNIERKNLGIANVMSNIFDNNLTNSRVVDSILYDLNLKSTEFDDFVNKVNDFEKEYLYLKDKEEIEKFYTGMNNDVIKFLEFISKVYTVLNDKKLEENFDKNYIKNTEDLMIISCFIGSYFFNNKYIDYFKDNEISYEKLLKFLNLKISSEDINSVNFDFDIIKQYMKNIFLIANNKNDLTIDQLLNDILNNECISNIITEINPNLNLKCKLTDIIDAYLIHKEELRKYELEKKFFGNMKKETIEYIKKTETILQYISEYKENVLFFTDDDLVQISLFLTLVGEYRLSHKYDELIITSLNSMYDHNDMTKYPNFDEVLYEAGFTDSTKYNIDFIYNNFGKYVFGGNNKNKKKKDIEIKDIFTNIFGCSFETSETLNKFLFDIEFDKSKLKNYDEYFINFKEERFIENVKNKICYESLTNYYENLSKIYQILKEIDSENNNIKNIEDSSQLLACFTEENSNSNLRISLLKNRKIDLESYLKYLNISNEEFINYKNKEVNYHIIDEKFSHLYYLSLDGILMFLFGKLPLVSEQHNKFVDYIKSLNQNPNIVEEEISSGKEVIVPMTQDEQIKYFNSIPVNKLEYSISSVSSFGKELSEHSLVIADEYLKIALMDSNENSVICNIQEELDKINPKKDIRSFFRKKVTGAEKIKQNKAILNNLNQFLEEKEKTLYEQIEHFEYLKKLIALYMYRLNNYILKLETIDDFEKNGNSIIQNMDYQIVKQIYNDKLSDFKKSLILSTEQYQKINLLLKTHAITLSKISTYRNTFIPNLYMELSIRDGIISEKESIDSLKKINDLLDNMVITNNKLLNQKEFNNITERDIVKIDDNISKSITDILMNEHLIENNNINKKDDSVKVKRYIIKKRSEK